jgi:hypothetical protein
MKTMGPRFLGAIARLREIERLDLGAGKLTREQGAHRPSATVYVGDAARGPNRASANEIERRPRSMGWLLAAEPGLNRDAIIHCIGFDRGRVEETRRRLARRRLERRFA